MNLVFDSTRNRFEVISTFAEKDTVKSVGGYRWDRDVKRWYTEDPATAAKLGHVATGDAATRLTEILAKRSATIVASRAKDADVEIPVPDGLAYYGFQKAGIAFLSQRRASLLGDDMGCIDGDAEVSINRAGNTQRMTLAHLCLKFNGGTSGHGKRWAPNIKTMIRSLCGEEFHLNQVVAVLDKGVRSVVIVTLASGKSLRVTPDHEVRVRGGFVAANTLSPGDLVLTNGSAQCATCGGTEDVATYLYAKFRGHCRKCIYRKLRTHPTWIGGRSVDSDGYVRVSGQQDHPRQHGGQVYEHVLVMESVIGRFVTTSEVVHHKNETKTDNRIENLELLTIKEHATAHGKDGGFRRMDGGRTINGGTVMFIPKEDPVVSVRPDGKARVYDVVCADPHRNFVANGIVVHNCGKSIQALGAINLNPVARVLVICPATLRLNWVRESMKWLVIPMAIRIAKPGEALGGHDGMTIINYDILHRAPDVDTAEFDLLIADEVQYVRNRKTRRSIATYAVAKNATRAIWMTGTPIVNRPIELLPILEAIGGEVMSAIGGRWKYMMKFCAGTKTQWGWDFSGAAHLDELQNILRSTVMIRRLKSEVLELPPKTRQILEIPANGSAGAIKREMQRVTQHQGSLDVLSAAVELSKASDNPDDYAAAVAALQGGVRAMFTEIAQLRHDTAVAKLPAVVEIAEGAVESSGKVVLFAHHLDVIAAICDHFGDRAVRVDGTVSMTARQAAVDRFQNDPTCQIFVGGIQAAGVGITLTAASHVIFAELDYVPGNMSQCEDRCYRVGTTRPVLVQHIVLEDSLDANIAKTLVRKQEIIDQALDTVMAREPVIPTREPAATANVSRAKLDEIAATLTPDQVAAIHEGLRYLAAYDRDHAQHQNGVGFSRIDGVIGHSLAEAHHLSPRQAALGAQVCRKYSKTQLPAALWARIEGTVDVNAVL